VLRFMSELTVAERFEFAEGLDAQDTVVRQAQLTRQRLDGFAVHLAIRHAAGGKPDPHDATAVGCEQALGGEELNPPWRPAIEALFIPAPVHASVFLRDELLGLRVPIAQIVAAAERVADAQQHPLIAERKEVRA
jgi:hypothetical protein